MSLNLYAKIEPYLGFKKEQEELHNLFLEKLLNLGVKKVLDIGCGSGDFLLKAQKSGLEIEGIDLSAKMVQRAIQKGVKAFCIDLCGFNKKVEAAVAIFDVLNYLNKKELKKFLSCVDNVLVKNGFFVCDINTLYGFTDVAQGSMIVDKKDRFIALDAEFEDEILETKITLFEKENSGCHTKESGVIKQYYHDIEELKLFKNLKLIDIDFISLFSDLSDKAILTFKKE